MTDARMVANWVAMMPLSMRTPSNIRLRSVGCIVCAARCAAVCQSGSRVTLRKRTRRARSLAHHCKSGRRYLRARATNFERVRVCPRGRVGCGSPPPAPAARSGGPRRPLDLAKSNSASRGQNRAFAAAAPVSRASWPPDHPKAVRFFFRSKLPRTVAPCAFELRQIFRGFVSPAE
jgi:hypothetical protein